MDKTLLLNMIEREQNYFESQKPDSEEYVDSQTRLMKLSSQLTDLEKVALTRSYVSNGVRATMDRYECTQQQIKVVAYQVRNEYVKEWCKKHKALPVDFSCILPFLLLPPYQILPLRHHLSIEFYELLVVRLSQSLVISYNMRLLLFLIISCLLFTLYFSLLSATPVAYSF